VKANSPDGHPDGAKRTRTLLFKDLLLRWEVQRRQIYDSGDDAAVEEWRSALEGFARRSLAPGAVDILIAPGSPSENQFGSWGNISQESAQFLGEREERFRELQGRLDIPVRDDFHPRRELDNWR
jgi:hypothetical protein